MHTGGRKVPSYEEPSSLVESAVVDTRKHFQKAVVSAAGTGPKDEPTASPIMLYIFLFSILIFNESTAVHLLPYCCTVKSNC